MDKSFLTGKPEDEGSEIVDSAYGFAVRLRNAGNDTINDLNVEIELDSQAIILETQTKPASKPGYEIVAEIAPLRRNHVNLTVPYVNPAQIIHVGLLSAGNNSPSECRIIPQGKGVQAYRHGRLWSYMPTALLALLVMGIIGIVEQQWIPQALIELIGGQKKMVTEIEWPVWSQVLYIALVYAVGIYIFGKFVTLANPEIYQPWIDD